jgi:hypothetical protein
MIERQAALLDQIVDGKPIAEWLIDDWCRSPEDRASRSCLECGARHDSLYDTCELCSAKRHAKVPKRKREGNV